MEMIKGIQGHGYYDELVVPIIENTAHERELTESLAEAVCFFSLSHEATFYCLHENITSISFTGHSTEVFRVFLFLERGILVQIFSGFTIICRLKHTPKPLLCL